MKCKPRLGSEPIQLSSECRCGKRARCRTYYGLGFTPAAKQNRWPGYLAKLVGADNSDAPPPPRRLERAANRVHSFSAVHAGMFPASFCQILTSVFLKSKNVLTS